MKPLVVMVVLGYFSGCWGHIITARPLQFGSMNEHKFGKTAAYYEYEVQLTCQGPHNTTQLREEKFTHEDYVHFSDWFITRELRIVPDDEKLP